MTPVTHKEYADGLRAIADFYEAHPEIPFSDYAPEVSNGSVDTKEDAENVIRALGSCTKEYTDDYLVIHKMFGKVRARFVFTRTKVCVRKVVGVETIPAVFVEAHTIPAMTREIVEWECAPILEPEDEAKGEPETAA